MSDILDAALAYARRGWRVVPNRARAKSPWLPQWPTNATTDEATIRGWWARCPGSNVGIAAGRGSGIIVVDLDGERGIETERLLAEANGGDGEPIRAVTGSGKGRHLIFRYDERCDVLNNKTKTGGEPIDIRTNGGQIVVAPSRHETGGRYQWLTSPDIDPGPMPQWLLDYFIRNTEAKPAPRPAEPRRAYTDNVGHVVKRAIKYLAKIPGAVSGCEGHDQTFTAARDMVYGFDLGPDVGLDLLANFYNPRCDPPWSFKDLLHKVADADTKPFGKPRGYLRNAEQSR